jgi:hypothetical protein
MSPKAGTVFFFGWFPRRTQRRVLVCVLVPEVVPDFVRDDGAGKAAVVHYRKRHRVGHVAGHPGYATGRCVIRNQHRLIGTVPIAHLAAGTKKRDQPPHTREFHAQTYLHAAAGRLTGSLSILKPAP